MFLRSMLWVPPVNQFEGCLDLGHTEQQRPLVQRALHHNLQVQFLHMRIEPQGWHTYCLARVSPLGAVTTRPRLPIRLFGYVGMLVFGCCCVFPRDTYSCLGALHSHIGVVSFHRSVRIPMVDTVRVCGLAIDLPFDVTLPP